ncbi:MAG: hypothetical protein Q27BB25_11000 [Blastomonas sp. CACIA14H2]|nr:MAG: hypothetical protein Q27BB25_11000 [Blastomonas sp. CACIA14H2]
MHPYVSQLSDQLGIGDIAALEFGLEQPLNLVFPVFRGLWHDVS